MTTRPKFELTAFTDPTRRYAAVACHLWLDVPPRGDFPGGTFALDTTDAAAGRPAWFRQVRGENPPPPFWLEADSAQQLADELWTAGVRPTAARDTGEAVTILTDAVRDARAVRDRMVELVLDVIHRVAAGPST